MSGNTTQPLFGLAPSLHGNNWMSRFDGSTSLAQLTMPGTHDSGARFNLDTSGASKPVYQFALDTVVPLVNFADSAFHTVAGVFDVLSTVAYYTPKTGDLHKKLTGYQLDALSFAQQIPPLGDLLSADLAQAQNLTIEQQLEAGVRFLDLRGRPVNDTLEIYHGAIPQDQDFAQAFESITRFLESNPTETVVVYTQRENGNELPIDFSNHEWMSDFFYGDHTESSDSAEPSDAFFKPTLDLLGANVSSFFSADPSALYQVRPDYLADLTSNFDGATKNGHFKSQEATKNFFNLLDQNYGIEVAPLTADLLLGEYQNLLSQGNLLQKLGVSTAKAALNELVIHVNSVIARFGLSWLDLQQTADASMEPKVVVDNDGNEKTISIINGPYNTELSYDQLLAQYVQEVGADRFYLEDDVPTLDEARGKIVLMVREMGGESRDGDRPIGIDVTAKQDNGTSVVFNAAGDPTVITQDVYEPGTAEAKWDAFINLADLAQADQNNLEELMAKDALYVNYLSATSQEAYETFDIDRIGPVGFAENALVEIGGVQYQGLNAAFEDVFLTQRPDGRYGSMLVDFIDEGMARQIFEMNSVVGSAFALNAPLEPTVMRVDVAQDGLKSIQDISFGLKRVGTDAADMILQSSGPGALPYSLDMLDGNWQARESLALGDVARSSTDLQAGVYVPVAILSDGTELAISAVLAHGPSHLEVTFATPSDDVVAPRAAFKLEGTDALVVPADTQTAVSIEVARLGQFTNGLAFYEAEQGTGAITIDGQTILPGEAGYLEGALSLAKTNGTIIRGDQMPEYGESATFNDVDLEAGLSYGLLLMHEGNENVLSSSFSSANRGGHTQIVELPSTEGSIWYGIEDLHVGSGVSDRDFNDLLVNVQVSAMG